MSEVDPLTNAESYHCICTTLILTTLQPLSSLPKRKETADAALILPLNTTNADQTTTPVAAVHNIIREPRPIVIKREDGFEKRLLLRCGRCHLIIGYNLDEAHFQSLKSNSEDVLYILPGSLLNTEDMKTGRAPELPTWAQKA